MKNLKYSTRSISVGLLFSMSCSVPVLADDTEIYTSLGAGTVSVQPNVLFVLDTSGSMDREITVQETYSASKSYTDVGCGSGRIYWSTDGNPPSCSSGNYFNSSALHCDHAFKEYDGSGNVVGSDGPLIKDGTYIGKLAHKRGKNWSTIKTTKSNHRKKPVECKEDQGIHGSNSAATPKSYIFSGIKGVDWSNIKTLSSWPGKNYTIFTSNYLNYLKGGGGTRKISRFQAVKEAIDSIVSTSNDINIGLMGFNGYGGSWDGSSSSPHYDGGQVRFAMEDIATARTPFINYVLDPNFKTNSWTPLSETYYEAIHYFAGKTPPYGTKSKASPKSVSASLDSDGTYKSPITNECQANHIVFLTDGDPTRDTLSTSKLSKLSGYSDMSCASTKETTTEGNKTIIDGNCLDRLAEWAYNNDVAKEPGSAHAGKQTITTNTISFGDGISQYAIDMLKRTAKKGGGSFYEAQNPNELVGQFNKIVAKVLSRNTTFSSPAVSVNAFNRSTHLDSLYFTLFKPLQSAHWPGNLKKYKLDYFIDVNDIDNDNDTTERLPFIADAKGNHAIDPSTGYFDENAESFWSGFKDGENVEDGGAAEQFETFAPRNVYTFTGSYTNTNGVFKPSTAGSDLTSSINKVAPSNAAITDAMLDIVSLPPLITSPGTIPRRTTLIDWASGLDVFDLYGVDGTTTDQRLEMGDPLHSSPALVQYGLDGSNNPDLVAYVATNDGYLQAIDVDNGKELFSFIPQELLKNINGLVDDTSANKTYGLDGDVIAWIYDKPDNNGDTDGTINAADGDHVYLYVGMRRGGNNIYSVDVTDRNNPKLRWVIKGGVGDFAELGQTWSTINVEKVKHGSAEKTVLIFGGGYDTNQDGVTVRTADSSGRAVYIVDAETGALLWSAEAGGDLSLAEMKYSIPARVKPLDISGDGFIDRLYVSDMGGQIFRFDIDNNNGASLKTSVTGGRVANLAGSGKADNRRFYYPPDVALIAEDGEVPYLALAITSGYRAHPNNLDIQDRIYMLKDYDIHDAPSPSYTTITEGDLYDATLNLAGGDGSTAQSDAAKQSLLNNDGWYIKLDDGTNTNTWVGEKGLAEALILEGNVIVTTFTPTSATSSTSSCEPQSGTGKVFFMDVTDASPSFPSNLDLRGDRHHGLSKGGIPPSPNVIITKGGEPTLCVGTECQAANLGLGVRKTHWYEVEQ